MFPHHLDLLACPRCGAALQLHGRVESCGRVASGSLRCTACACVWPIERHVPRFVAASNYAASFGLQWGRHARTQYDSHSGTTITRDRFFGATRWPTDLRGDTVLEVGSGAGRFTEQVAATGATVVSVDYSAAVDANHASNGHCPGVLIVQADLYRLPVRPASFERAFCFGVLQHCPDVRAAFLSLPGALRPGGHLAIDVYARAPGWFGSLRRRLSSKHLARAFTKGRDPERLYRRVRAYVQAMWPLTRQLHRVPWLGPRLCWRLLVADYRGVFDLPEPLLREWAVLDTFDMLSPVFDQPQTLTDVQEWFTAAGMVDIEVHPGHNGIEGRGRRPAASSPAS